MDDVKYAEMTYLDSARGTLIDRGRVIAELVAHGVEMAVDQDECLATCPRYKVRDKVGMLMSVRWDAADVLEWLGY